jgi:DNA-binding transcriptional MerR regulator
MKFRQLELFADDDRPQETAAAPPPGPVADAGPTGVATAPPPTDAGLREPEQMLLPSPDDGGPHKADPEAATEAAAAPAPRRTRRPARQAARVTAPVELPPDEVLCTRQYYTIGEVAAMFQLKVSVLRYWASEFDVLDLRKNRKGDRFFRPDDVKTVQLIHHLLRVRRFTIEGAREYIRHHARGKDSMEAVDVLRRIRGFLLEIGATLGVRTPAD